MSAFNSIMPLAIAIIVAIGFGVQAWGKWLELQTARINKELAKSKNEATEKMIESTSQVLNDNETPNPETDKASRWVIRYLLREQKPTLASLLLLLLFPWLVGAFIYKTTLTPTFVWVTIHMTIMFYILAYLSLSEAKETHWQRWMAERNRVLDRKLKEAREARKKLETQQK